MSDTCRACGADLLWAITREGKRAPLTRQPKLDGNVLVFKAALPATVEPVVQCRTFAGLALDALREQGVPLRLSHFADCAEADRFRS